MSLVPLIAQGDDFFRDRSGDTAECVRSNGVCPEWAIENFDRYVEPTLEHLVLVVVSVVLGFLFAFGMAMLSHRRRWLVPTFTGATGILYTIPSLAFFFLQLPITGRGTDPAITALPAYTLHITYRTMVAGLNNDPAATIDAGRCMGMTDRQVFWRIELPLAVPEIVAGLRIATVSTVAIATLAFIAGGGGLGTEIYNQIDFKTNVIIASILCVTMAVIFDICLLLLQAFLVPWRSGDVQSERRSARFFQMFRKTAT
jgi:osmoprotectant transport system permease protein